MITIDLTANANQSLSVLLGANAKLLLHLNDSNTVTQLTSNTTTVTLNTGHCVITMFAALGAFPSDASFTFTNSYIATNSVIQLSVLSSQLVFADIVSIAAGSCVLRVTTWDSAPAAAAKIHVLILNPAV